MSTCGAYLSPMPCAPTRAAMPLRTSSASLVSSLAMATSRRPWLWCVLPPHPPPPPPPARQCQLNNRYKDLSHTCSAPTVAGGSAPLAYRPPFQRHAQSTGIALPPVSSISKSLPLPLPLNLSTVYIVVPLSPSPLCLLLPSLSCGIHRR